MTTGEPKTDAALLAIIKRCVNGNIAERGELPCRVDEMTEREYILFSQHIAPLLGAFCFLRDLIDDYERLRQKL